MEDAQWLWKSPPIAARVVAYAGPNPTIVRPECSWTQQMDPWIQYAVPALIGLVAGIVGSLVAPWVNWGIEKKRLQHETRTRLLASVREFVSSDSYSYPEFMKSALYSQLLPHLSRSCREAMKAKKGGETGYLNTVHINIGGRDAGVNTQHRSRLLDEIARLEKVWGIT